VSKPLSVNMGFGIRQRSTTWFCPRNCRISASLSYLPASLTGARSWHAAGLDLLQHPIASGAVVDRPDALVSFRSAARYSRHARDRGDVEQRFLTAGQLEAKYGAGKASEVVPGMATTNQSGMTRWP
jgi:hypothetical protein